MRTVITDDVPEPWLNRSGLRPDDTGRKLVLRRDARRSTAALARALDLSRTAIQARIARLEADGVILGYAASIAPDATGAVAAPVMLGIAVRSCALVTDRLAAWPEVERVWSIAGPWDAVLLVSVACSRALSELADTLRAVPGIGAVETTVILSERQPPIPAPARPARTCAGTD